MLGVRPREAAGGGPEGNEVRFSTGGGLVGTTAAVSPQRSPQSPGPPGGVGGRGRAGKNDGPPPALFGIDPCGRG